MVFKPVDIGVSSIPITLVHELGRNEPVLYSAYDCLKEAIEYYVKIKNKKLKNMEIKTRGM